MYTYIVSYIAHHSPPQGFGEVIEVLVVLLGEVDQEAGEDQSEEADVERGYKFLEEAERESKSRAFNEYSMLNLV